MLFPLFQGSGTWSSSSPICPWSSSCPLPTSSLSRRGLQDPRRWVTLRVSPLSPHPWLPANPAPAGHQGQGVRDVGGAAAADTAGAGHGLGGLCHRGQRRCQSPVTLRWVLLGCAGLSLLQDQTLALNGTRDTWCHQPDPAVSADLWEYYLPYLYSCISLFGVLLLLCELCPPKALVVLQANGVWRGRGLGLKPPGSFWGCGEG